MGGMSGGKGGSAPSAPDFAKIAQQQADLSQQAVNTQTAANRPDQTNMFGATSNWTQDPTTGQWTQTSSLNGALGQGAQNLMSQIGSQGALPTGQEARDQAINSAYSQAASRLDPQWGQREESLRAQLANQGLDPGSEAAQAEFGNFGRNRNDAYTSAMASAIGQGTEAGNAIFNQGVTSQQLPYQQLQALQGLGQQQSFNMAGQAQTPDLMGAAQNQYQAALNQYGQQQGGKNSTLSGLGSLAGGAAGTMLMPGVGTALGSSLGGALGGSLGGGKNSYSYNDTLWGGYGGAHK